MLSVFPGSHKLGRRGGERKMDGERNAGNFTKKLGNAGEER